MPEIKWMERFGSAREPNADSHEEDSETANMDKTDYATLLAEMEHR